MAPYDALNFNFWSRQTRDSAVTIDSLMPNGLCIQRRVQADTLLSDFKVDLWREASNLPLFHRLKEPKYYVLSCVDSKGGLEELVDENRSIFDVQPFKPYFKVVEKQGNETEKLVNSKISMLIGKSLTELDSMEKNEEVRDFRRKYRSVCEQICTLRRRADWEERAMYAYPPQFADTLEFPEYLRRKMNSDFIVNVSVAKEITHTFSIPYNCTVNQMLHIALEKKRVTLQLRERENPADFILRIAGKSSFLFGRSIEDEEPELLHFKYIQECIADDSRPHLSLMQKTDLAVEERIRSNTVAGQPPPVPEKALRRNTISLWDIGNESMVKIKVVCATNINTAGMQVAVKCGIYHGAEALCDIMSTSNQIGSSPKWNEFLEFNLPVCHVPRMARMCFCIYGHAMNRDKELRRSHSPVPLSWVNVTMFDYNGFLRSGAQKLYAWLCHGSDCTESTLNPLGTVVSSSAQDNGPCLLIEFTKFAEPVSYPTEDKIMELAATVVQHGTGTNPLTARGSKQHRANIEDVIERDLLVPMFEQDKDLLWYLRAECCEEYPTSLPKLLQSMRWNRREDVAQMYFLLHSWRRDKLTPEFGLELLDYIYPDEKVRKFAVELLDCLRDNELEQYLLQLVQVLKFESYLDCSLARFLLKRTLNNRRLGHFLFWHLRSEMHNPQVAVRFGLMMEAYFRGSVGHLESLTKQYEALNKLKTVTELLKQSPHKNQEELAVMRECLKSLNKQGAFSNLDCPLDPSVRLKGLRVDSCKYMNSAKRPLWLVFENDDELGQDVLIIFKNGDDLRQDLLTLQVLRIMDCVWKTEGLDMKIKAYNCLPTGDMLGLIEVVQNAETVARIQAKSGLGAVIRDSILYSWMVRQESDKEKFNQMIDRFRFSCAGYCVATYVLGIGDRHNDNIMMHTNGQLFHIDFGHFLGNFKRKFGVRRERVPFVLTSDFLHIIRNGVKKDTQEIGSFRALCQEAFQKLRRKGNLFMTLFSMMMYTGIPELQKPEDLGYLRNNLALMKTEEEAEQQFVEMFRIACDKSWTTSLNWWVHNFKHYWVG